MVFVFFVFGCRACLHVCGRLLFVYLVHVCVGRSPSDTSYCLHHYHRGISKLIELRVHV